MQLVRHDAFCATLAVLASIRWNEFGRAVLTLQLPELKQPGTQDMLFRFFAFHGEGDFTFDEVEEKRLHARTLLLKVACRIRMNEMRFLFVLGGFVGSIALNVLGAVKEWWDSSSEAGAKERPEAVDPPVLPTLDVLAIQDGNLVFLGVDRAIARGGGGKGVRVLSQDTLTFNFCARCQAHSLRKKTTEDKRNRNEHMLATAADS